MSRIVIYGINELSLYLAFKLFQSKKELRVITPESVIPCYHTQKLAKFIPTSTLEKISTEEKEKTEFIFICDRVHDYGIFNEFGTSSAPSILIDCVSSSTKNKYEQIDNYKERLVKGFLNLSLEKKPINENYQKKETYFCTENLQIKNKIKSLSLILGYKAFYAGGLANEPLIMNMVKLQNTIKKYEFPDKFVDFYINVI